MDGKVDIEVFTLVVEHRHPFENHAELFHFHH